MQDDDVRAIDVAAVVVRLTALAAPPVVAALDVPSSTVMGAAIFGGAVAAGLTVFVAALGYVHRDLAGYIGTGVIAVAMLIGVTQEAPSVTAHKAQVAAQQREAYRQELARREDQRIKDQIYAKRWAGEVVGRIFEEPARRERAHDDWWNQRMRKSGEQFCDNLAHRLNERESYTACQERYGYR